MSGMKIKQSDDADEQDMVRRVSAKVDADAAVVFGAALRITTAFAAE